MLANKLARKTEFSTFSDVVSSDEPHLQDGAAHSSITRLSTTNAQNSSPCANDMVVYTEMPKQTANTDTAKAVQKRKYYGVMMRH